ncbi:MAG: LysR family transcriptional regulator [Caulobacter sp.]|nr:LysR family transcriptional regulator [Caulobacter sp.]
MEMQQIRYFLTLARTLNFTRAAEECHVTQPALTRAIQALEAELGGELMRRERQNSHLTDLGKRMLPLMQRCYDSALTAKELARSVLSSDVASLSLAVSHSVNLELLMPMIAELFRAFPGMQLKLQRGGRDQIIALLKDGGVDIAIAGPLGEKWERLDSWPIFSEAFEVALNQAHDLASANAIDIAKLAGQQILFQEGCESRTDVSQRLDMGEAVDPWGHQVVTHHDLMAMLEANLGLAIVPVSAPQTQNVRRMPLNDAGLRRTVSVYCVAGRQRSAASTTLLNLVRTGDWSRYAA